MIPKPKFLGIASDVADYCAKYVTKENAWWGVNLLGQRHPGTRIPPVVPEPPWISLTKKVNCFPGKSIDITCVRRV
jgi:hypothetical protein